MPGKDNLLPYPRARAYPAIGRKDNGELQKTRLALGDYFADIIPDQDQFGPVFHWVIQRVGSPEIFRLGQEGSFAHALDRAHECLEGLALRIVRQEKQPTVFYEFGELK